jgi:hypothetical protein
MRAEELNIAAHLCLEADCEAIGLEPHRLEYPSGLDKLGHTPSADAAYIRWALSPGSWFAGGGAQRNRRQKVNNLHQYGFLVEAVEPPEEEQQ